MAAMAKFQDQIKDMTEGWSKWQITTCVGAPIALGLAGLWYYKRSKHSKNSRPNTAADDSSACGDQVDKITPASPKVQGRQELAQLAKTKGNKLFKEGNYDEAIVFYTEAIKTCPPDIKADMSTFYQNRAAAFENMKNYPDVIKDCDSALDLNPRYSKALARRSKAREHLEKYRESLEDITKACLIEGFQNQAYLLAADRVLKMLGKTEASNEYTTKKPNSPSAFYVENYLQGFVNDPVALGFTTDLELNDDKLSDLGVNVREDTEDNIGDNGAVLLEKPRAFERAKSCLNSKEYDEIIALCDEEMKDEENSPHVAEALLLRGTMKLLQGMGDSAFLDLDRLGSMEDVSPLIRSTALLRAGTLKMQKDPSEDTLGYYKKAMYVCPNNSDVFHHYGQQLLILEKLDEAIEKFDKSIELSPNFPTAYVQKYYAVHRKAILVEDLSLLTTAKTGFEETIAKFPNCSDALILYAQALGDQGKFPEAETYFKKAVEVQPLNANNIVHRGLMLLQWKGDVDQTLKLLDEAIQIDPTCQYAFEIRGTIEVQRGNVSEAISCFKKAIAMSNSESEMAHLFSLMEAAQVQVKVAKDLDIRMPSGVV